MTRRRNPLFGHLYLCALQDSTLYKVQIENFNQAWAADSICQRIYDELRIDFELDDICSPCPRQNAGFRDKMQLMESILKVVEEDNKRFLLRPRERIDRLKCGMRVYPWKEMHMLAQGHSQQSSWTDQAFPSKKKVVKRLKGEFIPRRTCTYISQHDLHHGEMTVRETLDFSGRCLGVGTRYDLLAELSRREKAAGIKPDPEIDAFMKATAVAGQKTSIVTDYILKILGLNICADVTVGDEMRRGISGGQKECVMTGEMLVGPAKALFMDEISTGLDSSTTFQIVRFMKQMVHIMDVTMIISLLQPAPETVELFDDIILLSEGQIVYQGPRENVLEFFQSVGFKCPQRKGLADFLQEKLADELRVSYDKSTTHPAALVKEKYGISNWELFKACFAREWLLMKRNSFLYIFKTTQITIISIIAFTVFLRTKMKAGDITSGGKFYGALFFSLINVMFNRMAELALTIFRLPVFFKQRDFLFSPAWAFALPIWVLSIPLSFLESGIWILLAYSHILPNWVHPIFC
ncbi:hypothetical protein SLEP1_g5436 [Rubroshorea leprosula]|uniref:ABC transporter domain-containing protein n=1 Tax=Rubroshorea leprosula TaxID=152421 RepID=A0AAV5HXU7_9ROSI|nr:hypothetical protein SLEP1_g5436 [Rubroshorea leprosula]